MYNDTKSLPEKMPADLKRYITQQEERGSKNVSINMLGCRHQEQWHAPNNNHHPNHVVGLFLLLPPASGGPASFGLDHPFIALNGG